MAEKTLQELEAYQQRLAADYRRAQIRDPGGLNRNDVLVKNLNRVNEDIRSEKAKKANG